MTTMESMGAVHIQYEIDGHLYTTFAVAMLAGIPLLRALELSWGSQVPDANRKYTAISAAWNALWNKHSKSLMKTLHSLHGGDHRAVTKRREDLKSLLTIGRESGEPDWKLGLMIHAYGDSYAHTYLKNGKEKAYGIPHGHAGDGHTPDKIGEFPDKYLAYVQGLYQALGGTGSASQALSRIFEIVGSNKDDNGQISAEVKSYAAELGMTESESDAVRDKLLRDVTESDVSKTMASMEAYFARK